MAKQHTEKLLPGNVICPRCWCRGLKERGTIVYCACGWFYQAPVAVTKVCR